MDTGFEDEGRGHKLRDAGGLWKLEKKKGKETDFPLKTPEGMLSS